MRIYREIFLVLVMFMLVLPRGFSQKTDSLNVYDLSLDQLMNIKVSVATKNETTIRETPGVITVITREDIARAGTRDLVDVFQTMVPGFSFGVDVEGVLGMGFRGVWANEGKILMMIDGIEINEELFATLQFGNHFPVDNIERIEIIRGPGSAMYGGYAELAVINVITRKVENGGYVSSTVSFTDQVFTHRNTAFGFNKSKGNFSITINTLAGQGSVSDRPNVDFYGNSFPMKNNSERNIFNTNLSLKYKGLNYTTIVDNYETTQIDLWGKNVTTGAIKESFRTLIQSLNYDIKTSKHKISLKTQYKYQQPWIASVPKENYISTKYTGKFIAGIFDEISFSEKSILVMGYEFNNTSVFRRDSDEVFINGKNTLSINNSALFTQFMQYTKWVNLTLGGRFDSNSEYGSSFVPRLGITKAWKKFHAKLMVSQSFRLPGGIIPNRLPSGKIKINPEKATNFELEVGMKILSKLYFTINGYNVKVEKTITYQTDPVTGNGVYFNSGNLSTLGMEAEMKYVGEIVQASINYAYYKAVKRIDLFSVPGEKNHLLGIAPNRINGQLSVRFMKDTWLTSNLNYFGKRFGYTHADMDGNPVLEEFDSSILIDVNFRFNNFIAKGLNLTLGCHNLLNTDFSFIQPYNGYHAPLPYQSRSYMVSMNYSF